MQRFARRTTAVLAAAALGIDTGCYSYVTVPSGQEMSGRELHVTIADGGAGDLARYLGPRAASLEGKLVSRSDTSLTLTVTAVTRTNGVEESWPGDAVVLPRAAITNVAAQRIDKTRSILTTAAIVVGVGLIGAAIKSGSDVNRGPSRVPSGGGQ
jgi:hypothetical protein